MVWGIAQFTHQVALVPAVCVLVLWAKDLPRMPASYVLMALALATSWVGDSLAFLMGGSWAAFYGWVPVQIALAFLAVETDPWRRAVGAPLLCALALWSFVLTFPGPEILTMGIGSLAIVLLAKGPLRLPAYLYFGIGTGLYLVMVLGSNFMDFWYGYQASRVGAIAVFVMLAVKQRQGGEAKCT